MPTPLVRPRAQLIRVVDADSYVMGVDVWNAAASNFELVARTFIRLRDYGARELHDTALEDPKGLGRITGPAAKAIAEQLLAGAGSGLMVEPKGFDKYGRLVAWVWLGDVSLGARLAEAGAVASTSTKG